MQLKKERIKLKNKLSSQGFFYETKGDPQSPNLVILHGAVGLLEKLESCG